jgi:hypothetical protein
MSTYSSVVTDGQSFGPNRWGNHLVLTDGEIMGQSFGPNARAKISVITPAT